MADLILHHFDISPFGEKARLALGLKALAWQSVQIPLVMPKPGNRRSSLSDTGEVY